MSYETEANTFLLGAALEPMDKVRLTADLSYTIGTGSMSDVYFGGLTGNLTSDLKLNYNVSTLNPNMRYLYDTSYLNEMANYSDLDFAQLDITLGASYQINQNVGVGLNYFYTDLDDSEEYVYGEQSSTLQSVMGYLTYSF
jgi:hypothetical protein